MRWDLDQFKGKNIKGSGLLELTTYSINRSIDYQKDFGMLRVCEILDGDPDWKKKNITFDSFTQKKTLDEVINSQMIIDISVNEKQGAKNLITISNPILQRMIDGHTLGIAIKPLGAINASFYSLTNKNLNYTAKLHFNTAPDN